MNTSLNSTLRYTRLGRKQNAFIGNQLSHLLLHLIRHPVRERRQSFHNLSPENVPVSLLLGRWKRRAIKINSKRGDFSVFALQRGDGEVLIKGLLKRRWCTDVVAQEAKSQSSLIGKLQDDEINCPLFSKQLFAYVLIFQLPFFRCLPSRQR